MAEEAPKGHHPPTSNSDLMGSAKTVAEAAQLAASNQSDKIDKAKVAGAAEDVLEAAKSYGKLDDKSGAGQYVDKAETYLHQYHSSSGGAADKKEAAPAEKNHASAPAAEGGDKEDKEKSSGGVGGLMNMAKGLF